MHDPEAEWQVMFKTNGKRRDLKEYMDGITFRSPRLVDRQRRAHNSTSNTEGGGHVVGHPIKAMIPLKTRQFVQLETKILPEAIWDDVSSICPLMERDGSLLSLRRSIQ